MSQKQFKQIGKRHLRKSLSVFKEHLLAYEVAASWWAKLIPWGPLEGAVAWHFKRKVARKYKRFSKTPKVLEVGCSTGYITRFIAKRFDCEIIGIDLGDFVLEIAREETQKLNLTNVTFQTGNVENLPFASESFNGIFMYDTLQHVCNRDIALKECLRILTPEGVMIVYDYYAENYLFSLVMFYVTLLCSKLNIEIHLLEIRSRVVTYFLTKKKFYLICADSGLRIRELNIKDWKRWIFRLGKVVKLLIQSKN